MSDETYVTSAAWVARPGRADAIDEVADQFERPDGATRFWNEITTRRLARAATIAPRAVDRRAG